MWGRCEGTCTYLGRASQQGRQRTPGERLGGNGGKRGRPPASPPLSRPWRGSHGERRRAACYRVCCVDHDSGAFPAPASPPTPSDLELWSMNFSGLWLKQNARCRKIPEVPPLSERPNGNVFSDPSMGRRGGIPLRVLWVIWV